MRAPLQRSMRSAGPYMAIITPAYPSMNSSHNVSTSTFRVIQQELRRGTLQWRRRRPTVPVIRSSLVFTPDLTWRARARRPHCALGHEICQQIEEGTATWEKLFEPVDFFGEHKHFLQVSAISEGTEAEHSAWSGRVESMIRKLVQFLENARDLEYIRPLPQPFACHRAIPATPPVAGAPAEQPNGAASTKRANEEAAAPDGPAPAAAASGPPMAGPLAEPAAEGAAAAASVVPSDAAAAPEPAPPKPAPRISYSTVWFMALVVQRRPNENVNIDVRPAVALYQSMVEEWPERQPDMIVRVDYLTRCGALLRGARAVRLRRPCATGGSCAARSCRRASTRIAHCGSGENARRPPALLRVRAGRRTRIAPTDGPMMGRRRPWRPPRRRSSLPQSGRTRHRTRHRHRSRSRSRARRPRPTACCRQHRPIRRLRRRRSHRPRPRAQPRRLHRPSATWICRRCSSMRPPRYPRHCRAAPSS